MLGGMRTAESLLAAVVDAGGSLVRAVGGQRIVLCGSGIGELTALDDDGTFLLAGARVQSDRLRAVLAEVRAQEALARADDGRPRDGEGDPYTGLGGPRTWSRLTAAEDARCTVLGHPAAVAMVTARAPGPRSDPDGDLRWQRRVAVALRRALRAHDALCVLAPGRYGVLAVECAPDHAERLADRLSDALLDSGIGAVARVAVRTESGGVAGAATLAAHRLAASHGVRTLSV